MLRDALLSLLTVSLAAYLAAAALAWLFAERLIFQPQAASYEHLRAETRLVPVGGGDSIAVRWLPNPDARHTLLFSHGNAEDLGDLEPFLQRLQEVGFAVLAYDYRGYGLSTRRRPTERRAYADHEAAYRFLTGELGVDPGRVILHGRSLGGGVASDLATRCPAAGLILESTFTSTFRVAAPRLFPFDRFPVLARVPRIAMPLLVIHGTADEVVPIAHGRLLHSAGGERSRSYWVRGAGHNDVAEMGADRYFLTLRGFAADLPSHPSGSADPRGC